MADIIGSDADGFRGKVLRVEKSVTTNAGYIALHPRGWAFGVAGVHLSADGTRRLRDELTAILGEEAPEKTWAPKVGDRVVVVRARMTEPSEWDGKAGELETIDAADPDGYPYYVRLDEGGEGQWVRSIRPEPADDTDLELADHLRTSAAQDAADFDRRSAAAEKARELLRGSSGGPFVADVPSEERIIRLAMWLLGENN